MHLRTTTRENSQRDKQHFKTSHVETMSAGKSEASCFFFGLKWSVLLFSSSAASVHIFLSSVHRPVTVICSGNNSHPSCYFSQFYLSLSVLLSF